MIYLGDYLYGAKVVVPFPTFSAAGASITMSGLAVTDLEVYKGDSMTQRASDSGYALLDTDGIDLDTATGVHGFSIDTADFGTAGFFGPGSDYYAVVNSITVETQTVRPVFLFSIQNRAQPGLLGRTTIAAVTDQLHFTLTAGSADNDAYNKCMLVIHDAASVVQKARVIVADYVGSSKTVTLRAAPCFTIAAGDYVEIFANDLHLTGDAYAEVAHAYWGNRRLHSKLVYGVPVILVEDKAGFSLSIAGAEAIADVVHDEALTGHGVIGTAGKALTDAASQSTAGAASAATAATQATTAATQSTAANTKSTAIQAKTDKLTFDVDNLILSNEQKHNDTEIIGTGTAIDPWRAVGT